MKMRGMSGAAVIQRAERISAEEATELMALRDKVNVADVALKRAQIARETMALDYAEVEQRVSRKYKLNVGDGIGADGRITRAR